ncbi:MAG: hypothetical protein Q9219_003316 [cf. Caloplaca sp. 3 TL-2023]
MHSLLTLVALFGLASAIPTPQLIDIQGVEAAPDPVFVTPAYDVPEQAGASNEPAIAPRHQLRKRDGNCAVQPAGSGPISSPDTPDAFLANSAYATLAKNATTPDGYSMVMQNSGGSLSASNYMGLKTLKSYDTLGCASLCDQATGCQAFNMYIERDPSLDPNAVTCPNPPSTTNFKCTLWGAAVSAAEATNLGQWRDSFHVLIAGSNAYNKATPPSTIACYNGPVELGGAINAPLNAQGQNTYMGYNFHAFSQTQGYDPSTCAADCNAQTAYNKRHPAADGSYQTCIFFNAYVLSVNGVPQGLYCSKYSQVWAASYATNYGQYRGTDRYTVSRSYSYSLNLGSDGSASCNPSSTSRASTVQTSTTQPTVSSSTQATTSQSTTQSQTSSAQPIVSLSTQATTAQPTTEPETIAQTSITTTAVETSTSAEPVTSEATTQVETTSAVTTSSGATTTASSADNVDTMTVTSSVLTTSDSSTGIVDVVTTITFSEVDTTSTSSAEQVTSSPSVSATSTDPATTTTSITPDSTTTTATSSIPDTQTTPMETSTSTSTQAETTTTSSSTGPDTVTSSTSSPSTSATSTSTTPTSTASTLTTLTSATSTLPSTTTTPTTSTISTTSSTSSISSTSTTSSTSSTPIATLSSFCLQNPSTKQFASLTRTGNGLSFNPTTPRSLPSLFFLDSSSRLTSRVTGTIAALQLPTFGKDGTSEGHISGETQATIAAASNRNLEALTCDAAVVGGYLVCRSAANYIDAQKTPSQRSRVDTTTKGNDGVDQYVFEPTAIAGAVAIRVLPASACGPNYS